MAMISTCRILVALMSKRFRTEANEDNKGQISPGYFAFAPARVVEDSAPDKAGVVEWQTHRT
jgi:hypothetical protein